MKTKKISWQAIAIVVLALVLIASIALGVSGAWFQDKDNAEQSIDMGKPVLIKLANNADSGEVESFGSKYKADVKAFPGDFVLGATKVMAASDTATIYRAQIVTEVTGANITEEIRSAVSGQTPSFGKTQADEFKAGYKGDYTDWTGANPEGTVTYSPDEIKYNLYLINTMLDNLKNTNWISNGKTGAENYIYYKQVSNASEVVLFENGLNLSEDLTNACANWTISVTLSVEAIQAANADTETHPWNADLKLEALKDLYGTVGGTNADTTVLGHNAGRRK